MRALRFGFAFVLVACGGGNQTTPDGGVSTDNCTYQPLTPTAHAGGTVTAAALQAGAADNVLDIPVGTALGGYTARAGFLGSAGVVDARKVKISGTFNPSIGVEAAPRVKAIALTAGPETVVFLKVDMIFVYEGMLYDLEQRLGPEYAGKVIITSSHSHSSWAQFTGNGAIKLGSGQLRQIVYDRYLETFERTARDALEARRPAKLGVFVDTSFDPQNVVNHDRRGENNMLPGGNKKDDHLVLLRIDGTDNVPIAILPIFGEHGTLNGEENPLASSDAPGALERGLQEQFDTKVVVMHVQSAGGDNSPSGHGGIDCNVKPGAPSDPCLSWATEEGHGRGAAPILYAAWQAAGAAMRDTIELEMLTRSIETGPYPDTFKLRDGALTYAPFDLTRTPDGKIYDDAGKIISPIDEFNAPVGAGLCESATAMFPAAAIAGTDGLLPYGSCLRLDVAGSILGDIFKIDFGLDDSHPICQTTRTTISALRLGDYVIGTMPGELTVMLAQYLRDKSPVGADHTILVGYSQGHVGYMLEPEDWLQGGYEPSVTFWGPLEAEYIANRLLELMPLAMTPMREDGTTASATRVATATMVDGLDIDDPAPMAGTVPATVPVDTWARTGHPAQAQPAAQIARVSGTATFVWLGDDPNVQTPHVTLERETMPGTYTRVARRSGRVVDDVEVTIAYTPEPLQRSGPQTHVWVAEWQAVPWQGAVGFDSLDERGGVPLGNYRFHVDGKGWTLDSQPFQVIAGGLVPTAIRGSTIQITARWHAPKGWRLMDMSLASNQPVPVRSQAVTVDLLSAANATLSTTTMNTDANGSVSIPNNALATSARVIDRFGNTSTVPIQ
ncbi:MAG: Alkaline ceramidase domain protein [Myxococcales bacterium]|nr:Alkaline ceramidase domain protein [Myxococcales bacterium]